MDIIAILTGLKGKALELRDIEFLKHAYELQEQNIKQLKENNEAVRDALGLAKTRIESLESENADLKSKNAKLVARNNELDREHSETHAATHESDIKAILESWLKSRTDAENERVINYAQTDRELRIPLGSTRTHIVSCAAHRRFGVSQQGEETILLHRVHDAPSVVNVPSRFSLYGRS